MLSKKQKSDILLYLRMIPSWDRHDHVVTVNWCLERFGYPDRVFQFGNSVSFIKEKK